jgi:anti-repressor protein
MSNQLIPVVSRPVGSETIQTVNARQLHQFLCVGKDFSNWIKDRIESFGFVENQDFVIFANSGEKGRPSKEYALTLDMAKELSMVERNAKGKQARQYFIECERQAKEQAAAPTTLSIPTTRYIELLESENRLLRATPEPKTRTPRAASPNTKRTLDELGICKQLHERFVELHGNKSISDFWRETRMPLTLETVTAALLRNHRKSPTTVGIIASYLKFDKHDIRVMMLKMRNGNAAVMLT